jgi:hypothetical protein
MANLLQATVEIEGTRPLLFNCFSPDALPLEKQEKSGVAGNVPDEWRQSVLMTPERQLYLPKTYFFSCVRNGATFLKRGRSNFQKLVSSTLDVLDEIVLLDRFVPDDPIQIWESQVSETVPPVYISVAGVRNPSTKARNIRYRVATSSGWRCQFNLRWDKTVVTRVEMQSICIDAGRLVGLADGRAIGYGRFEVKDWNCKDVE